MFPRDEGDGVGGGGRITAQTGEASFRFYSTVCSFISGILVEVDDRGSSSTGWSLTLWSFSLFDRKNKYTQTILNQNVINQNTFIPFNSHTGSPLLASSSGAR